MSDLVLGSIALEPLLKATVGALGFLGSLALIPNAGIQTIKETGAIGSRPASLLSGTPREIRTLSNPGCALLLWSLIFSNRTKMTKYEALEKNVVSNPKTPGRQDLRYSRSCRKAQLYWDIFALIIGIENRSRVCVAEGEELGSNLLRVAQSSLWGPSGHLGPEPTGGSV